MRNIILVITFFGMVACNNSNENISGIPDSYLNEPFEISDYDGVRLRERFSKSDIVYSNGGVLEPEKIDQYSLMIVWRALEYLESDEAGFDLEIPAGTKIAVLRKDENFVVAFEREPVEPIPDLENGRILHNTNPAFLIRIVIDNEAKEIIQIWI